MKLFAVLFCFIPVILLASPGDTLNRIDSLGKRQGYWKITAQMKKLGAPWQPEAVVEEGRYINGYKTGMWTEYYQNGNPHSKMEYLNNRPNGSATLYFEKGGVSETGTWKGTRWIGEYRSYYENDTLKQLSNFNLLGQREGMQYSFYDTGDTMAVWECKGGKENGSMRMYYRDGSLQRSAYYSIDHPDSNRVTDYPPPAGYPRTKYDDYDYDPTAHDAEEEQPAGEKPKKSTSFDPESPRNPRQ